CASATGRKLRPMIVFAGAPGAVVLDELREDKRYDWERGYHTVQAKAYCDKKVMEEWIVNVWAPDIQGPSVLLQRVRAMQKGSWQHRRQLVKE
ncbi:hypothetical protein PC110_g8567, partial [Phytophthora cactorum]